MRCSRIWTTRRYARDLHPRSGRRSRSSAICVTRKRRTSPRASDGARRANGVCPIDPVGWVEQRRYRDADLREALTHFRERRAASLAWLDGIVPERLRAPCPTPRSASFPGSTCWWRGRRMIACIWVSWPERWLVSGHPAGPPSTRSTRDRFPTLRAHRPVTASTVYRLGSADEQGLGAGAHLIRQRGRPRARPCPDARLPAPGLRPPRSSALSSSGAGCASRSCPRAPARYAPGSAPPPPGAR